MEKLIYMCDRGSLALRVNGTTVLVGNGVGDGVFSVFVGSRAEETGEEKWRLCDTFIDGPTKVEVMDYDCYDVVNPPKPIHTIELKSACDTMLVFKDDRGNMLLETRPERR